MLKTEELKAEIRRMCDEKGAIILAHAIFRILQIS